MYFPGHVMGRCKEGIHSQIGLHQAGTASSKEPKVLKAQSIFLDNTKNKNSCYRTQIMLSEKSNTEPWPSSSVG